MRKGAALLCKRSLVLIRPVRQHFFIFLFFHAKVEYCSLQAMKCQNYHHIGKNDVMWDMKWKKFAFRQPPMFLFSGVNIASWANTSSSCHKQPQLQIFIKPRQLYLENISGNWLIIASYTAYTLFSESIKWHESVKNYWPLAANLPLWKN